MAEIIENRTFDEIEVGDSASLVRTLSERDIHLFAVMSGDVNPAHVDENFAKSDMFHKIIAHGMWGGALISTVLGTQLPGPGTIYLGQSLRFRRPVGLGDTVTVTVTASDKQSDKRRVTFDCRCTNQHGEEVITGTAEVIAPERKVRRERVELPEVRLHDRGARYRKLVARAEGLPAVPTAVVHPVEPGRLLGAVEAARAGLVAPVLVGPEAKVRAAADTAGVDLSGYRLEAAPHSHAAAALAVELARAGEVAALAVGTPKSGELLRALAEPQRGLRTERALSHVLAMDVPGYPRALFITDAFLHVAPDLEAKRDIAQNAIDLMHALGIDEPRVALLAARETLSPELPSTVEAAALCKMAERGQITGALLDGPLGFDAAVSERAAEAHGIASPVAGRAEVLLVPDLEAGQMLAGQLEYGAEGQRAGIVLGARVPVAVAGDGDGPLAHQAAYALAALAARHRSRRRG